MKWQYVIPGIILVALAVLLAFSTPFTVDVARNTIGDSIVRYVPMEGTEDFVWESDMWTFVGTGNWSLQGDQVEYGSLYKSENDGEWLIITQRGQVVASGVEFNTPKEG